MTAENGANTGQQFFCTEWLCNIIICAQIQCLHFVPFVGTGRQDNDRNRIRFPDFLNQVQTIPIRQAKIQND